MPFYMFYNGGNIVGAARILCIPEYKNVLGGAYDNYNIFYKMKNEIKQNNTTNNDTNSNK